MDARTFQQRLMQRLAGSQPNHAPEHSRFGARLNHGADERLLAMMPRDARAAAVLIGFQEYAGEPAILLTVRAGHLRKHAGQISFPGGRIEASDADPAAAAIREAHEEIGLAPQGVTVIGQLPDQIVLTGFRITPVVARVDASFAPRLDPSEVQELFELPLSQLLDTANHQTYRRSIAGTELDMRDIRFGHHRIWGAPAGILRTLREYALE